MKLTELILSIALIIALNVLQFVAWPIDHINAPVHSAQRELFRMAFWIMSFWTSIISYCAYITSQTRK